ncbi:hypothetical protein Tco_0819906 [Tanacetum coccineum]|uniref:Uncharacterized protein n=1 Tax=Tanacetum coccineum TaxID=301880 RepID=A0ABQ5AAX4_9ASTR
MKVGFEAMQGETTSIQATRDRRLWDYDEVFAPVARFEEIDSFWILHLHGLHCLSDDSRVLLYGTYRRVYVKSLPVEDPAHSKQKERGLIDKNFCFIKKIEEDSCLVQDIMFAVCLWASFQVTQRFIILHAVKRIFREDVNILKMTGLLAMTRNNNCGYISYTEAEYVSSCKLLCSLAAEEEHSYSPLSRGCKFCKDAQGTPTQSAAHSHVLLSVSGTASFHGTATHMIRMQFSPGSGTASCFLAYNVQEEDTAHPFFDDIVDKDAVVTPDLERKSDEIEEVNIEEKEASNVKSGETEEHGIWRTGSKPTPFLLQVLESEEQLKLLKLLLLFLEQLRALETTNDEDGLLGNQDEWMQKKKEKVEELKETKAKDTLRKPIFSCSRRNQLMNFLKVKDKNILDKI